MTKRIKPLDELNLSGAKKLALIGTTAYHRNRHGAWFPVRIEDYRYAYADRYLSTPLGGRGAFWTTSSTLALSL